jgi:hypothetical protein
MRSGEWANHLQDRIEGICQTRVGNRRGHRIQRREGWSIDQKARRIYRELGL